MNRLSRIHRVTTRYTSQVFFYSDSILFIHFLIYGILPHMEISMGDEGCITKMTSPGSSVKAGLVNCSPIDYGSVEGVQFKEVCPL